MNARGLRRYVDDLLRGRRPTPFRPHDFEAAQIHTAIDLKAARAGGDAPRQEFLSDLHRRLAAQMRGTLMDSSAGTPSTTRRQVIVGTSAAAAAAAVAVTADRLLFRGGRAPAGRDTTASGGDMVPNEGSWQAVAASSDVPDGVMHAFEHGWLIGFVRRVDGRPEAVSGVCTHQGCRLWFDKPDDRLRCPCHSTSFSPTGQVVAHQLPIAPRPLPRLEVREVNGAIEVFAPTEPTKPGVHASGLPAVVRQTRRPATNPDRHGLADGPRFQREGTRSAPLLAGLRPIPTGMLAGVAFGGFGSDGMKTLVETCRSGV